MSSSPLVSGELSVANASEAEEVSTGAGGSLDASGHAGPPPAAVGLGSQAGGGGAGEGSAQRLPARGDPGGAGGAGLTASEARRLRKQQRKEERHTVAKTQRRERKKERKKRRIEAWEQKLNGMSVEERERFLEARRTEVTQRRIEDQASLQRAFESGRPKVVINCSFSDTMSPMEKRSLAKQAQMAYTAVRDLRSPIQLHLASVGEENLARGAFEQIGAYSWTLHRHDKSVWELFEPSELVVLTPDAEEDLEQVEADKIYVIGGIVDRTVCKRQSYEQAVSSGAVCLRRLPIKAHGPYGANPILNINHVVHILAEWLHRGGDWPGVLEACVPQRRVAREDSRAVRRERNRQSAASASSVGAAGEGQGDGEESDSSCASSSGQSLDLAAAAAKGAPLPATAEVAIEGT